MARTWDAIVIGAGHNGLTTAAYLARAGLGVLVLERRPLIGGAAVSEQHVPGFTYSTCSYVLSLLRPEIVRDLDLPRFGLEVIPYDYSSGPTPDGPPIILTPDHERSRRFLARISPRDAEGYDEFALALQRQARLVKPLLMMAPPDPTSWRLSDLKGLARLYRDFSAYGEAVLEEAMRFWTMSCADFLDEYFANEAVKAFFGGSAIVGTSLGIRSPGSAYVLLHHYVGEIDGQIGAWGYTKGAMGGVSRALAGAAEAHGAVIRVNAPVERVVVRHGRAAGVVLEGGEEIAARLVVSNLDVKRTYLGLFDRTELEPGFVAKVERFKSRGSSGKLNVALDGLPTFPHLAEEPRAVRGTMYVAPSVDYLERAYDDAKYGCVSREPWVEIEIPSVLDPTLSPPGKHMASVFVQYAPSRLANGPWDEAKRQGFAEAVLRAIDRISPDFRRRILHMHVRTPNEIEEVVGITEGNIFHGELTFDQLLFNRPIPGFAQYKGPIEGFYMCGSSTHPGGGVMAAPGALAARRILADQGRRV
jgi:phytoene dehydrogenase-like protein